MIYYKGSGANKFFINNGIVNGSLNISSQISNVLPNEAINEYSGSKGYITVGDWNGDGLDDLAFFNETEGLNRWFINKTVWENGSGQIQFQTVTDPINREHIDNNGSVFMGDWNGDGIQDLGWHHPETGNNRWYINDGTARFSEYRFNPISKEAIDGSAGYLMSGDWNGDGLEDVVWHHTDGRNRWFLNKGNLSFRQMTNIEVSTSLVDSENTIIVPGDFDASGTTDVLYYNKKTGNNGIHLFKGKQKVEIVEFYDPLGSKMELVYENLIYSDHYIEDEIPAVGNTIAPPPMSVIVQTITDDGLGGIQQNEFEYWDYTANIRGYGSLGFRKQVSTDTLSGMQTLTEYSQDYENHTVGMVSKTSTKQFKDGYEKLLNETINTNDVHEISYDGLFVRMPYLSSQQVSNWDFVTQEYLGSVVTDYVYRTDGDLEYTKSEIRNPDGTVVSISEKTMTYEPVRYSPHYLAGLVSTIESTNTVAEPGWVSGLASISMSPQQLTSTRKTAFTYYEHGAPFTQIVEPGHANALTTTFEYNSRGQSTKTTTSASGLTNRVAITRYYANGREYQQENTLGHTTTYYYENTDYPWLVTKVVDPNGLASETLFDEWGRTLTNISPDGNSVTQQMKWCDVNCKDEYGEVYYSETTPSIGMQSWVFFDKEGREVRKTAHGFHEGTPRLIHQITEYNSMGKIERHSEPFFENDAPQWNQTWYDDLGRMLIAYDPAGNAMINAYLGQATQSTRSNSDGVSQSKTVVHNAAGQLIKVIDDDLGSEGTAGVMQYAYDAQGNLVYTQDSLGSIIKAGFDVFGNKQFTDDPNKGRWVYEYDGFGQLISQTDARGIEARMEYDALGRMVKRYDGYGSGNQELTTWEYDTAALGNSGRNALGMLLRVQMPAYIQTYQYDELGRSSSTTTDLDNSKFRSSITYDNVTQQPDTVTYPQEVINNIAQPSLVLKNHYHSELGIVTKVTNNTTGEPYWELEETNAKGQATLFQLGNGMHTSRSFNEQTGYIDTINTYVDGRVESIQDMAFYFDGVGNLRRRHDYIANVDQYVDEYDRLNRIKSVRTVTPLTTYTQDLTYDAIGNILTKSDVGSYTYGSTASYQTACGNNFAGPQAVTYIENGAASKSYCYDANGNMVEGDGRTITYGNIDKPITLEKGADRVDFFYGPDRSRYKRVDDVSGSISTTYYLGAYEKIIKGSSVTHKYYIGNYAVVTKDSNETATHYLLTDHQGSIVARVDTLGNVLDRYAYDPWGRRLTTGWEPQSDINLAAFSDPIISRGYTGHEHIDSMGLIHMNGRVYDPTIARFLSSDPFVQDATNTQALNRYAYVQNNPLSYTDPSGYFLKKIKKALKKVAKAVKKAVKAIIKMHGEVFLAMTVGGRPGLKFIARQLGRNKYGAAVAQLVGCTVASVACPVIVGIITTAMAYGATGDLSAALVSGLGAAAVSWAMQGVQVKGDVSRVTAIVVERSIGHVASSAMNGAVSAVNGGSFTDGFNASFKIKNAGEYLKNAVISHIAATAIKGILNSGDSASTNASCGGASTPNPIDIQTGRKFLIINDLKTGRLSFVRHYNSFSNRPGSMGEKWRHEFEKNLEIDSHTGIVIAVRGDGQTVRFNNAAESDVKSDGSQYLRLRRDDQHWLLTNDDDSVERYNSRGQLVSITYRDGYEQHLIYEDNLLSEVMDSDNRFIDFRYNYTGLLVEVISTGGRRVGYRYNVAHALTRVAQLGGNDHPADYPKVHYLYEDVRFPHALTGLVDEAGSRFGTWEYDAQMRAFYEHQQGQAANYLEYQDGNITTLTDALGRSTIYHFNDDGKPVLVEGQPTANCIGANNQYEYDDNGQLVAKTDWNGNRTEYKLNDRGLETRRVEAAGTPDAYEVRTEWHNIYRLPVRIEKPGITTVLEYDSQGQLVKKTLQDTTTWWGEKRIWQYTYNDLRQLIAVDGPQPGEQDTTRFEYDTAGNRISVINPLHQRTRVLVHNADGQPALLQDQNGTLTRLDYSARGWLSAKSVQLDNGEWATTRYDYTGIGAYDGTGLVATITQPNGASVAYEYNAARQVTAIQNNLGERIEYDLDPMGNRIREQVISYTGELKRTQANVYDELSRLLQKIGADGARTEYSYDPNGNVTRITDALDHATRNAYDGLNRLVSSIDALQGETTTKYNSIGAVAEVTDARGVLTQYEYNGFGDVVALISQDTGTTTFKYDLAGNLIRKEDANGIITEYRYDALNRLAQVLYPQAPEENIQYHYDVASANAIGRLASVEDQSGATQRTYDGRGNVLQETRLISGQAYQMAYGYDNAGKLISMTYPNGTVVRYHRDQLGRVEKITRDTWMGETLLVDNIQYLPFGPMETLRYGNGLIEARDYDLDYRLRQHKVSGLYNKTYDYNPVGNISSIVDGINAANDKVYEYDELSRLTLVLDGTQQAEYFQYDAVGNRTLYQRTANGDMVEESTYRYAQASNRLTSVETAAATRTMGYDPAGNTVQDNRADQQRTLKYGANNRLQLVTKDGLPVARYRHNAQGQRVIRMIEGDEIHYIYDTQDRLVAEAKGDGSIQRQYVYLGRMLIAVEEAANDQWYFVHNDHLGTPKLVSDAQAKVIWRGEAAAFGSTQSTGELSFSFRFPGQTEDAATGYFYNYFRDYDPRLGRYLQSDPIGLSGGINTYGYAMSNSIVFVDPNGLRPLNELEMSSMQNYFSDDILGQINLVKGIQSGGGMSIVSGRAQVGRAFWHNGGVNIADPTAVGVLGHEILHTWQREVMGRSVTGPGAWMMVKRMFGADQYAWDRTIMDSSVLLDHFLSLNVEAQGALYESAIRQHRATGNFGRYEKVVTYVKDKICPAP